MVASERRNVAIFILGVIIAFVGWRVGPGSVPTPASNLGRGQLVFPGLADKLAQVTRIAIESGGKTLVLRPRPKTSGGGWGLESRGLYPVQTDKLRAMLSGLTLIREVAPRTSNPSLYSRIGVENPATKGGTSTEVSLYDSGGKQIAALIVGHRRVRTAGGVPDEIYIRRPGEAQSWLAHGNLEVDANPQLWLVRNILDIDPGRIAGVAVDRDGQTLDFATEKGTLHLASPADHPALDPYKLDDIKSALQQLTLEDVAPATTEPGKPVGTATFTTTDGLSIAVSTFRDGTHLWAQFHAGGKGAGAINARLGGWTYEVGSWMERQLTPTLTELEPAKPATTTPAKPAPATTP